MKIPKHILKEFGLNKRNKYRRRQGMTTCCVCHKYVLDKDTELKLFKKIGKHGAIYRPCCKSCKKENK